MYYITKIFIKGDKKNNGLNHVENVKRKEVVGGGTALSKDLGNLDR